MDGVVSLFVVVIISIFLSVLKSNTKNKAKGGNMAPPVPRQPRTTPPPVSGSGWLPLAEAEHREAPLDVPTKPYVPASPRDEGVHAVKLPEIVAEDAYAEPHPDVPVAADWRRAIIAHEILKTKF